MDNGHRLLHRAYVLVEADVPASEAIEDLARQISDLEILSHTEDALLLTLSSASHHLPQVFGAINTAGGSVSETSLRSPNLETLFLLLTGKELRE